MVYASAETGSGAGAGDGVGDGDGDGDGDGVGVGVGDGVGVTVPVVPEFVPVLVLLACDPAVLAVSEPVVAPPPQAANDSMVASAIPPTHSRALLKILLNINISFLCPF